MFRIILIVCVALGLLTSLLMFFWIRSRMGKDSLIAETYAIMKTRNTNFRRSQYLPIVLIVLILGLPIGAGVGWLSAGFYLLGAVVCYITVILFSLVSISGAVAATNSAYEGNIAQSNKISYRAGAIMGLCASSFVLSAICALLLFINIEFVTQYARFLGLGFAILASVILTNGSIYSSSFALALDSELPDEMGFIYGTSADLASSFALSAIVAIMLSKSGVFFSDVFSTFNNSTASIYPLTILAVGIVASLIVTPMYGGGSKKNLAGGSTIGCLIVGVIVSGASIYLSTELMQTSDYAIPVISGVLVALILGELQKLFSSDSKIHVGGHRADLRMSSTMPVVYRLSVGMTTTIIVGILATGALVASYLFAKIYGIALMAIGIVSTTGIIAAITWLGYITQTVSNILKRNKAVDRDDENEGEYLMIIDKLDVSFVRSSAAARSYSSIANISITIALFVAFTNLLKSSNVDILDPLILGGMIAGASIPFFLTGIISNCVRISARVINALGHDDEDGSESSIRGSYIPVILAIAIPALVAFLFGINTLLGLLIGVMLSGIYILITGNNAGEYFAYSAHAAIASLVKLILIFSIAYLPLFMKADGLLII